MVQVIIFSEPLGCSSVDTHGGDIYAHSEALQSLVKVFDFDFTAG